MTENITEQTEEKYLPNSTEKKQAVLMYFFVGLLLSMGKQEVSPYMFHHIKQAMGLVVLIALCVFLDIVLFIFWAIVTHFFTVLGGLITFPVLIFWGICTYQAWKGEYQWSDASAKFLEFFSWLWVWILNLFDANHYQVRGEIENTEVENTSFEEMQNQQGGSQIPWGNIQQPQNDLSQFGINETIGKPLS